MAALASLPAAIDFNAHRGTMFAAEIREIKQHGLADTPWVTLELPTTVRASVNKSDGHTFFRVNYAEPQRIPVKGDLILYFMGDPVLRFCYGEGGPALPIPTVRSAMPGACRTVMPSTPQELKTEFAGYSELSEEMWVQLNPLNQRFTLQVRLRKMLPGDTHRELSTGCYYIYGVDSLVVHVNKKIAPAGDKDRALLI